jgi:leucine dehydrogenase
LESFVQCKRAPCTVGDPRKLANKTVAIQGCGSTGYNLAKNLFNAGAKLIATDLDQSRLQKVVKEFAATAVAPEEIYSVPADIFAPCAFGGVINEKSIRQLKAEIVVGSANNQLLCDSDGELLAELEILYAPDCIANSGGMINGCRELLGWDAAAAKKKIDDIYDRMLAILNLACEEKVPPYKTAERLARKLIRGN